MSADRLIQILTEIRDQQRQQVANFEQAIQIQQEHADLQRKGRQTFLFMVYAPWLLVLAMIAYALLRAF
ncbi:MAG: hypothetical protein U1D55_10020 [Phycisphaerae bacterium]